MKVKRKAAVLRVDVVETEAALLGMLIDDFATLLAASDDTDPAMERLFPNGYTDDDAASQEYRALVVDDLRAERDARLQLCRAELPVGGGRFELDNEAADRWIRVLNDLRLTLGVRLGVSEDSELDSADEAVTIYHWLTSVQDMLVTHLMA
jgi:hypothetical protein